MVSSASDQPSGTGILVDDGEDCDSLFILPAKESREGDGGLLVGVLVEHR